MPEYKYLPANPKNYGGSRSAAQIRYLVFHYNGNDGVYRASEATLSNAAALGRELMRQYHIPVKNVVRHFDVTGKHCPSYLVSSAKWAAFLDRLTLDNIPSPAHKSGVEWALTSGILRGNSAGDLMLSKPVTREQLCTMLYRACKLMAP